MSSLANWASIATILGLVVAVITLGVMFWLDSRDHKRWELSYAIDQILLTPVEIKSGTSINDIFQIYYKDKLIKNIFVVRVSIKNTGGKDAPIKREDLLEPIRIIFEPETMILRQPEFIKLCPKNIIAEWSPDLSQAEGKTNIASLTFDILNPSWEVISEFVCSGQLNFPKVQAKIDGVSGLHEYSLDGGLEKSNQRSRKYNLIGLVFSLVFVVLGIIGKNIAQMNVTSDVVNNYLDLFMLFPTVFVYFFIFIILLGKPKKTIWIKNIEYCPYCNGDFGSIPKGERLGRCRLCGHNVYFTIPHGI